MRVRETNMTSRLTRQTRSHALTASRMAGLTRSHADIAPTFTRLCLAWQDSRAHTRTLTRCPHMLLTHEELLLPPFTRPGRRGIKSRRAANPDVDSALSRLAGLTSSYADFCSDVVLLGRTHEITRGLLLTPSYVRETEQFQHH